ncbi:hypothetical protein [Streptomyces sp. NPDC047525]|uniref:hypothetical protein n=1 Tax=Streptomyces sp. NPDC047525 TaxID=3155264 RepID=UPI0033C2891D
MPGLLKDHLLPAWGEMPLGEITPTAVATWLKQLRASYKPTTVAAIGELLSLILSSVALERLIPVNSVRLARQRGRTRLEEAARFDIITAAYTGMRRGELTGLRRAAADLDAQDLATLPPALRIAGAPASPIRDPTGSPCPYWQRSKAG